MLNSLTKYLRRGNALESRMETMILVAPVFVILLLIQIPQAAAEAVAVAAEAVVVDEEAVEVAAVLALAVEATVGMTMMRSVADFGPVIPALCDIIVLDMQITIGAIVFIIHAVPISVVISSSRIICVAEAMRQVAVATPILPR
jgi:hypothetical protein